jgi:hypothetical protein
MFIAFDVLGRRYRPPMRIMELVWPVTALYLGPLAVWGYLRYGRPMSTRWLEEHRWKPPGRPRVGRHSTRCRPRFAKLPPAQQFAHVTRVEFEHVFAALGPVRLPAQLGPDAFWSAVQTYYLDSMAALAARPRLAALVRAWLATSGNATLQRAQQDMEHELLPSVDHILTAGQASGAVRTDLPSGLLIAVALGMGRAMDTWLLTQPPTMSTCRR